MTRLASQGRRRRGGDATFRLGLVPLALYTVCQWAYWYLAERPNRGSAGFRSNNGSEAGGRFLEAG